MEDTFTKNAVADCRDSGFEEGAGVSCGMTAEEIRDYEAKRAVRLFQQRKTVGNGGRWGLRLKVRDLREYLGVSKYFMTKNVLPLSELDKLKRIVEIKLAELTNMPKEEVAKRLNHSASADMSTRLAELEEAVKRLEGRSEILK